VKILHFTPVYAPAWSYGGPVRSISALCKALASAGHQVTVATTTAGLSEAEFPGTGEPQLVDGVSVLYFKNEGKFEISSRALTKALSALARQHDVVHVSSIWQRCAFGAHRAARIAQKPVVLSPRGAYGPYAWRKNRLAKLLFYRLFERQYVCRLAGVHFTSEQERRESLQYFQGPPSCVIPNGIDPEVWHRDETKRQSLRRELGIGAGGKLLLYAGRMHHKKGLQILPSVLAELQGGTFREKIHLLLVGPDEDGTLQELKRSSEALGFSQYLHTLPTQNEPELRRIYSTADIFVMPSRHENFGNSAIEALACGCPGVVSAETACHEFGAGAGLRSVPNRNPTTWADAITQLLIHPRSEMVNVSTLLSHIGLSATAKLMINFYRAFCK
jgi:glycosyltransferase involved in cell wall biosynthesis